MIKAIQHIIYVCRGGSIGQFQREQDSRRKKAKTRVKALPAESRNRFTNETLVNLIDSGWLPNRWLTDEEVKNLRLDDSYNYPDSAISVLREFGDLNIGFYNRTIHLGFLDDWLKHPCSFHKELTGIAIYPIGWTNLFCDDGLGVYCDDSGAIYIDGQTGNEPPQDGLLEKIGDNFDFVIDSLFTDWKILFGSEELRWYYDWNRHSKDG